MTLFFKRWKWSECFGDAWQVGARERHNWIPVTIFQSFSCYASRVSHTSWSQCCRLLLYSEVIWFILAHATRIFCLPAASTPTAFHDRTYCSPWL